MALINLQTDLTSLKYGHDRPAGGSSNQPYIQTDIPDGDLPAKSPDFLLRNGYLAPVAAAKDTSRITQMLFDTKSPRGLLFTAKENLLSRLSVKTQASKGPAYAMGTINQGVYLPTSTIAQTLVGFTGTHLNLLGLDPSSPMSGVVEGEGLLDALGLPGLGLKRYEDIVNEQITPPLGFIPTQNRLEELYDVKIQKNPKGQSDLNVKDKFKEGAKNAIKGALSGNNVSLDPNSPFFLSYGGGPGSVLGIGNTKIKFADNQRTGYNSNLYKEGQVIFNNGKRHSFFTQNQVDKTNNPLQQDFRKAILKRENKNTPENQKGSTIMGISPSYKPKDRLTIDNSTGNSRINYTSPGQKGNIINYTKMKRDNTGNIIGPVDRINASPIYRSSGVIQDTQFAKNDLVKFRIAAIDNTNPSIKDFMHFRAYIDSFSDAYNGSWTGIKYMGRGEQFHKYDGFNRTINLSFTVAAQSKQELIPMYKKLNYLASNLAPSYSTNGYMAGSLVQLTLGGWCYELPGFITSLTLDIPQESPWEIGINTEGGSDSTVKELPMIIKVSGFSFTPIEEFRPSKQTFGYGDKITDTNTKGEILGTHNEVTSYDEQRYIALADGKGANHNNYDN